jgi:ABC transporter substrate binding protein
MMASTMYHTIPRWSTGWTQGVRLRGRQESTTGFRNVADEGTPRTVALELARQQPDLIVAFENQTLRATHAATSEIPVVFLHVTDPVAAGVVRSLGTRVET